MIQPHKYTHPFPSSYYRILSRVPCAIQQVPVDHPSQIQKRVFAFQKLYSQLHLGFIYISENHGAEVRFCELGLRKWNGSFSHHFTHQHLVSIIFLRICGNWRVKACRFFFFLQEVSTCLCSFYLSFHDGLCHLWGKDFSSVFAQNSEMTIWLRSLARQWWQPLSLSLPEFRNFLDKQWGPTYSTWNYIQSLVIDHDVDTIRKGMYICVYIYI